MKAAGLIINPISGSGADPHVVETRVAFARAAARQASADLEIVVSQRAGHPGEIAREFRASGVPLVIAWGGDGTVNEVASALAGSDIPLAIVPAGSGNGLATELGISRDPRLALRDAFGGVDCRVDAGEVNGRLFVNLFGIGFDGHVARRFQALARGRRGALPYLTIGLRSIWGYRPGRYRVALDDSPPFDVKALLVAFGNGRQYGNNAVIAPRARFDDGLLEAVVVRWWPAPANFLRLHHLFRRTADRAPGVISRAVRRAVIESDRPMEMHVDGEIVEPALRATVAVRRGAIRLRGGAISTPAGTAPGIAR